MSLKFLEGGERRGKFWKHVKNPGYAKGGLGFLYPKQSHKCFHLTKGRSDVLFFDCVVWCHTPCDHDKVD